MGPFELIEDYDDGFLRTLKHSNKTWTIDTDADENFYLIKAEGKYFRVNAQKTPNTTSVYIEPSPLFFGVTPKFIDEMVNELQETKEVIEYIQNNIIPMITTEMVCGYPTDQIEKITPV